MLVLPIASLLLLSAGLSPAPAKSLVGKTHVFWHKAKTRKYFLADCTPGPCLPKDAVVHDGILLSGSEGPESTLLKGSLKLGHGGESIFLWSEDLCRVKKGKVTKAKIRAEFRDGWCNKWMCRQGPIKIRCGVVNFQRNIDAYKKLGQNWENPSWLDTQNEMNYSMGYNSGKKELMAEEIIHYIAPRAVSGPNRPSVLDGKFFEVEVTKQVNWVMQHKGQHAILLLTSSNKKNMGFVTLYGYEKVENLEGWCGSDHPWTKDGNTCHLVVREDANNPLVFGVAHKKSPSVHGRQRGKKDTIPPNGNWVSPKTFETIRSKVIQLEVDAKDNDGGSGVAKVVFYASYLDSDGVQHQDSIIGEVNDGPYSMIWDCAYIPDQDAGKLVLYFDVIDASGNISPWTEDRQVRPILDENTKRIDSTIISSRREDEIIIDGYLDEWRTKNPHAFSNNKNVIAFSSQWDKKYLYFGIQVHDKSIVSQYEPGIKDFPYIYLEDEIELFFEPQNEGKNVRTRQDKQFLIAAAGLMFQSIRDSLKKGDEIINGAICSTRIIGTPDNVSDIDTGYIIECAFAWKEIGIRPKRNLNIGFNLHNTDLDYAGGKISYGSWSGAKINNLHNPSEWGTLVLDDEINYTLWLTFGLLLTISLFAGYLYLKKQGIIKTSEIKSVSRQEQIVALAEKYMQANFSDPMLNRDKIAENLNLSSKHFGRIFNQVKNISLPSYLNEIRLNHAKEMLTKTNKKITEIAFDVGFGSADHFIRIFKQSYGATPSEFRKNA